MIKQRDFSSSSLTVGAILSDSLVELLSSVGPVATQEQFSVIVNPYWGWETTYGEELFAAMQQMDIPPLVPLPKKSKPSTAKKRGRDTEDGGSDGTDKEPSAKKKKDDGEIMRGIPAGMQSYFQLSEYRADFDVEDLDSRFIDFDVSTLP